MSVQVGEYNMLKVSRQVEFGFYLDNGAKGILLPARFAPPDTKVGDTVKVFVYHDSEGREIATTEIPKVKLGEIAMLRCVSVTPYGAFLDWGLMKDLFVARSQQLADMKPQGKYFVQVYKDEQTGRLAATAKFENQLSNETLTVQEMDMVHLLAYRQTELGWVMIINNRHMGLLHSSQVFTPIQPGDRFEGFVKTIREDQKIDVVLGKPGYEKVEDDTARILRLLKQQQGKLPFNDKSSPESIYAYFGMSKKAFKMALGALYKQRLIVMTEGGIEQA
jgi:predicted RNA-binding protein (virulence factor B family)